MSSERKRPQTGGAPRFVRSTIKEVSVSLEPMEQREPGHIAVPPSRLPPVLSVVEEVEQLRVSSARRQQYYQQHLAPLPGWRDRVAKSVDRMRQLRAAPPPRRNFHQEKNDPMTLKVRFTATAGMSARRNHRPSTGRPTRGQAADGPSGVDVYDECSRRCDEMITFLRDAQRVLNMREERPLVPPPES